MKNDLFVVSYKQLKPNGIAFDTWRSWYRTIREATQYGLMLMQEGRHSVMVWKDERDK
jgi:hypothetical protein